MFIKEKSVILSADYYRSKEDRYCEVCGLPIYAGEYCTSIGYVDRREERKGRFWLCDNCNIDCPQGSPPHIQRFLYQNRFIQEVYQDALGDY